MTNIDNQTPWQRVYARLGISQSELARELNRHRSKISRALKDEKGFINGRDQAELIKISKKLNRELSPSDLMPGAGRD